MLHSRLFSIHILLITVCVNTVLAQVCSSKGQYCTDDKSCCGGCCRHKICVDTHQLCSDWRSPCATHICPGAAECVLYQPSCEGCEAVPICV